MHVNEPVKLTLLDGSAYDLTMTFRSLKKVLNKYNAKSFQQLLAAEGELVISDLLYECLPKDARTSMTQEEFEEKLPANMDQLAVLFVKLFGKEPEKN